MKTFSLSKPKKSYKNKSDELLAQDRTSDPFKSMICAFLSLISTPIPAALQWLLAFVANVQSLAFLYFPMLDTLIRQNSLEISFTRFHLALVHLTNPQLLLLKVDDHAFTKAVQYTALTGLLLVLLYLAWQLCARSQQQYQQQQQQRDRQLLPGGVESVLQAVRALLKYFFISLSAVLFAPALSLMLSHQKQLALQSELHVQVICILNAVLLVSLTLFSLYYGDFSFAVPERTGLRVSKNSFQFLLMGIKLISVIVFTYSSTSIESQIRFVQLALVVLALLVQYLEDCAGYRYTSRASLHAKVVANSVMLCFVAVSAANYHFNIVKSDANHQILLILLVPLATRIFLQARKQHLDKILLGLSNALDRADVQRLRISLLLQELEAASRSQSCSNAFMLLAASARHRSSCKRAGGSCYCHGHSLTLQSPEKSQICLPARYVALQLNASFWAEYIYDLILSYGENVKAQCEGSSLSLYLHYVHLLRALSLPQKAFQELLQLAASRGRGASFLRAQKSLSRFAVSSVYISFAKQQCFEQIQSQFDRQFYTQTKEKDSLQRVIFYYNKISHMRGLLKRRIVDLLEHEKQLYARLLEEGFAHTKQLFGAYYELCAEIRGLQAAVHALYRENPQQKEANIIVYFYESICQNLELANQYHHSLKSSQAQKQKSAGQELFAYEIGSMTVSIGDPQGKILSYTSNLPQFFDYSKEEFRYIKQLVALIPSPVCEYHHQYVERFLVTQKCPIFRQFSKVLAQNRQGLIQPLQLVLDINHIARDDLVYSLFFQKQHSDSITILTDASNTVATFTKNLFNLVFNIDQYDQQLLTSYIYYLKTRKAEQLLPTVFSLGHSQAAKQQHYQRVHMIIPAFNLALIKTQKGPTSLHTIFSKNTQAALTEVSQELDYLVDVFVHQRKYQDREQPNAPSSFHNQSEHHASPQPGQPPTTSGEKVHYIIDITKVYNDGSRGSLVDLNTNIFKEQQLKQLTTLTSVIQTGINGDKQLPHASKTKSSMLASQLQGKAREQSICHPAQQPNPSLFQSQKQQQQSQRSLQQSQLSNRSEGPGKVPAPGSPVSSTQKRRNSKSQTIKLSYCQNTLQQRNAAGQRSHGQQRQSDFLMFQHSARGVESASQLKDEACSGANLEL